MKIERLDARRELDRFIEVPWRLYDEQHDSWVPPLRRMRSEVLHPDRNPLFDHTAAAYFLARDGGRTVGRIAAFENRAHNRFHDDRVGFFGFLDAVDDAAVVASLVEAAEGWLADRDLELLRGPVNPSTNYEAGMLVDGFGEPPTFMTTWNPSYLPHLVEGAGLAPARDLLGFRVNLHELAGSRRRDRLRRLAGVARRRHGLRTRQLDLLQFDDEMDLCRKIYVSAWSENWGFTPPSEEEWRHLTRSLRALMVAAWAIGAEIDGEPIAFLLTLPDYSRALRRIDTGRLLPFGWFRFLQDRFHADRARVVLLGVRSEYRRRAALPLLVDEVIDRLMDRGVVEADASWILEDNRPMVETMEYLGAHSHQRWRIYERRIADGR